MYEVTFSPDRALESILYLAKKIKAPTIHGILKLRYFADKIHLSKYGFMASGDTYHAMQYGPVASETYNLVKASRGDSSQWIHPYFIDLTSGSLATNGKYITALRGPNTELLSKSDIECMDEAINRYGNMSFEELTELSHDSAWNYGWNYGWSDGTEMPLLEIVKTLDNADDVLEYMQQN